MSDLLVLELLTIGSCHVGAGPRSSVRVTSALTTEPSPAPKETLLKEILVRLSFSSDKVLMRDTKDKHFMRETVLLKCTGLRRNFIIKAHQLL